MKEQLIYIAGPYTAKSHKLIQVNIDRAENAARYLAGREIHFICPHLNSKNMHDIKGLSNQYWIDMYKKIVPMCTGILLLKGWKESDGTKQELAIAKEHGLQVYYTPEEVELDRMMKHAISNPVPTTDPDFGMFQDNRVKTKSMGILEEATLLTSHDRNEDYGHPSDDFECIIGMFNVWYAHKYRDMIPPIMSKEDHAIYMVFVKLAREANMPKRDNLVDAVGYLRILAVLLGYEEL